MLFIILLSLAHGRKKKHKLHPCERITPKTFTSTERCEDIPGRAEELLEHFKAVESLDDLASFSKGSQHLRRASCRRALKLLNCVAGAKTNLGSVWRELHDEKATTDEDLHVGRRNLSKLSALKNRRRGGVVSGTWLRQLWPNGVIVYKIQNDDIIKQHWKEATDYIKKYTCLDFELAGASVTSGYIQVQHGTACQAGVTKNAATPYLTMGPDCIGTGAMIHEIMHVAGFFHEQSRSDRDLYINIETANIKSWLLSNWDEQIDLPLPSPYDFSSIMHYGPWGGSISGVYANANGRRYGDHPTMTNKRGQPVSAGQRRMMSQQDVEQINFLYKYTCRKAVPTAVSIETFPFFEYDMSCIERGPNHGSSSESACGQTIYNDDDCRTNIFAFKQGTCQCCTSLADGYTEPSSDSTKMFFVVGPSATKTLTPHATVPEHPFEPMQKYLTNKITGSCCGRSANWASLTIYRTMYEAAAACDANTQCTGLWHVNCNDDPIYINYYLCKRQDASCIYSGLQCAYIKPSDSTPVAIPTKQPTNYVAPVALPTKHPTPYPTNYVAPVALPTKHPTAYPTNYVAPVALPTKHPTAPTASSEMYKELSPDGYCDDFKMPGGYKTVSSGSAGLGECHAHCHQQGNYPGSTSFWIMSGVKCGCSPTTSGPCIIYPAVGWKTYQIMDSTSVAIPTKHPTNYPTKHPTNFPTKHPTASTSSSVIYNELSPNGYCKDWKMVGGSYYTVSPGGYSAAGLAQCHTFCREYYSESTSFWIMNGDKCGCSETTTGACDIQPASNYKSFQIMPQGRRRRAPRALRRRTLRALRRAALRRAQRD